jgi:hypothetical protein
VESFLSQFFHNLRHFSSQANERSTTQRCCGIGIFYRLCINDYEASFGDPAIVLSDLSN